MNTKILFPGSFDPFTTGHQQLVEQGLGLFDHIIIAVGYNPDKAGWIPVEERVAALRRFYADNPRISVESYSILTADFAREQGATAILRGVRSIKDFEYEREYAQVNRQLTGIETVLLLSDPSLSSVSSSIVRELFHFGRDISGFVPRGLYYDIMNK